MEAADTLHMEHAEPHHPSPARYVGIALVLAVVTAIEVGLFYVELAKGLMITLLIALSVVKFALVAMFFMHLKFDHRLFTGLFAGGIAMALVAAAVVLACFRFFQV